MTVVQGLSLYIRDIQPRRHGTPVQLAQRLKAMGLSWVAFAAVWQEKRGSKLTHRFINSPADCRAYGNACEAIGIQSWVWGYPWQGAERAFIADMVRAAGDHRRVLLNPELGSNPHRSLAPPRMSAANAHAVELVHGLRNEGISQLGLSTYGLVPKWFPLDAFLRAGLDFVGGQTYTEETYVDRSIAMFLNACKRNNVSPQLVPNYGTYSWAAPSAPRRARSKTPEEQRAHLMEFINEQEPVDALIGWAENFVTPRLEPVLAEFARLMARGACRLPRTA